ncbi:hypothetical protein ACHRV5_10900 [Flavobacterium sp. FlaQc-52]|uniref:hypothetical protein n=1 Tax=Flavobacterium sp. FlaQc-52 TaxID=3374185 RepID=UPI0037577A47
MHEHFLLRRLLQEISKIYFMLTDQNFIVFVGNAGSFGNGQGYTSKQQIDDLVDNIINSAKSSVSLHFHGGLVGRESGLEGARSFVNYMQNTDSYPVCFIWETDFVTTLKQRLLTINKSPFFKKILLKALKKFAERYVPAINSRGGKNNISEQWLQEEMSKEIPFSSWNPGGVSSSRGLLNDKEFERGEWSVIQEIKDELENDPDIELEQLVKEYNKTDAGSPGSRSILSLTSTIISIGRIIWRSIKRFHYDRDHGFYPTVVEEVLREFYIGEIGAEFWGLMKDKAVDMWNKTDDEKNVASYFMNSLINKMNGATNLKVNLIGHSAGSIAVLEGYRSFFNCNHSNLIKEIIFIAPACRFDLMKDVMKVTSPLHGRWSIFGLSDEREKLDIMIPILYPQSLLYFVSGLFETEEDGDSDDVYILGMERFWKKHSVFENDALIKEVKNLFSFQPHGTAFAAALGETLGRRTDGLRHGQIDDDEITKESIQYLISN